MPTYKTERDAWQALLDVLEGYGMPPYPHGLATGGLCAAVTEMRRAFAITFDIEDAMHMRIAREVELCRLWHTQPRDAEPRIPYVRKFIEDLS
jgi:hypothetical protein